MDFISVKGVHKSYKKAASAITVLNGIDVDIRAGETVAVLGASGAGKSTLLNILGALDAPTKGEVFYKGRPFSSMNDGELALFRNRTIGFVFQFHHLLSEFTALENAMLPSLIGGVDFKEAKRRASTLLDEVGLGARLDHKPGELSGGEQQRVAIVRAIAQSPEIILADEPTGNLDTKTGEEVFELLLRLNRDKNIAIVAVTHNEALAKRLSRRLRMVDGKIAEQ